MKPALATVCSLDASLATILEDYAAGQCDSVDLWLGHAEGLLADSGPAALDDLLSRHGITAAAASFQGGLLTSQGEARLEHWKHFESRLAMLREVGIPVLVIAGDTFGPLAPQDLGRLSMSLAEAAKRAADAGIRLALEFDARASFPNNLQSAVALVEDVGLPSLGLCLDWFTTPSAPASRSISISSRLTTSPTYSSPISPTCRGKWRATPTGFFPAKDPRLPTSSSAVSERSGTRVRLPSNSTTRRSGECRRGSSERSP